MKTNLIWAIAIISMLGATSVSSLNERSQWSIHSGDRHTANNIREIPVSSLKERPEWGKYFDNHNAVGTIYLVDERPGGGNFVYNRDRAITRFTPASTFKIPHALFALDAGIVENEFQVFP